MDLQFARSAQIWTCQPPGGDEGWQGHWGTPAKALTWDQKATAHKL